MSARALYFLCLLISSDVRVRASRLHVLREPKSSPPKALAEKRCCQDTNWEEKMEQMEEDVLSPELMALFSQVKKWTVQFVFSGSRYMQNYQEILDIWKREDEDSDGYLGSIRFGIWDARREEGRILKDHRATINPSTNNSCLLNPVEPGLVLTEIGKIRWEQRERACNEAIAKNRKEIQDLVDAYKDAKEKKRLERLSKLGNVSAVLWETNASTTRELGQFDYYCAAYPEECKIVVSGKWSNCKPKYIDDSLRDLPKSQEADWTLHAVSSSCTYSVNENKRLANAPTWQKCASLADTDSECGGFIQYNPTSGACYCVWRGKRCPLDSPSKYDVYTKNKAVNFQVGDRVQFRFRDNVRFKDARSKWDNGVVTSVKPLKIHDDLDEYSVGKSIIVKKKVEEAPVEPDDVIALKELALQYETKKFGKGPVKTLQSEYKIEDYTVECTLDKFIFQPRRKSDDLEKVERKGQVQIELWADQLHGKLDDFNRTIEQGKVTRYDKIQSTVDVACVRRHKTAFMFGAPSCSKSSSQGRCIGCYAIKGPKFTATREDDVGLKLLTERLNEQESI